MQYLLRVEAVNFDSFIYDTQHLHTIRGGGLLLLEVPETLCEEFPALKGIAHGASAGLYAFEAPDESRADALRNDIASFLQTDWRLRHATFVVDVQPRSEDFVADLESVTAKNRWRQWSQLTVTIPMPPIGKEICEIDHLRPASGEKELVKGEKRAVSESVRVRLKHGRDQKNRFYEQESGLRGLARFVRDFDDLTFGPERHNLHHKMAVIYIDGNSFGKIRGLLCGNLEPLSSFSQLIRGVHQGALTTLLAEMRHDLGFQNRGEFRLETLLWGGDEVIWVAPAWRGWAVLRHFFEQVSDCSFGGEPETVPLTYSAGMVFCHHNAPIHRIVRLAKDLAESAKRRNHHEASESAVPEEPQEQREKEIQALRQYQHWFEYAVLESFDHVGLDLAAYRTRRYRREWPCALLGSRMGKIQTDFLNLKREVSQGAIIELANTAVTDLRSGTSTISDLERRFEETQDWKAFCDLANLELALGKPPFLFFHLAELWDYIVED